MRRDGVANVVSWHRRSSHRTCANTGQASEPDPKRERREGVAVSWTQPPFWQRAAGAPASLLPCPQTSARRLFPGARVPVSPAAPSSGGEVKALAVAAGAVMSARRARLGSQGPSGAQERPRVFLNGNHHPHPTRFASPLCRGPGRGGDVSKRSRKLGWPRLRRQGVGAAASAEEDA